jgi:hypothetical protein
VPFVRVSRDKRGYEHIYLFDTPARRAGHARVLYWYRTPPDVKVGREPFDADVRRRLEEQNPGVHFDWDRLSVIPAPPPDVEHWRERRRLERAAKQARRAAQLEESEPSGPPPAEEELVAPEPVVPEEALPQGADAGVGAQTSLRHRRRRRGRGRGGPGAALPEAAAPQADHRVEPPDGRVDSSE